MQVFWLKSAPWLKLSTVFKLTIDTRSHCISTAAKVTASNVPITTIQRGTKLETLATAFVAGVVRNTGTVLPPNPVDSDSQSPAQISRAAAQAVRIAFKQGSFKECFTIIRSLRQSTTTYDMADGPANGGLHESAFDFGQAVNSRLSEHVLLHCFLRDGQTLKAGEFVKKMINRGIRVHPNTLNHTVQALCATDVGEIGKLNGDLQIKKPRMDCLNVRPTGIPQKLVQSRATNMALLLFFKAKHYERQRSWRSFQSLVDACMLQGEILVISFLLAFLVKQWQVRTTITEAFDQMQHIPGVPCGDEMLKWPEPGKNLHESLQSRKIMNECFTHAIQYLEDANRNNLAAYKVAPPIDESAQALVNVASLLSLCSNFPQAHQVLSIARQFKSTSVYSWVSVDGSWQKRLTKKSLDDVLNGLVNSIATGRRDNAKHHHSKFLPPEACDQLLLHATSTLKSSDFAAAIIEYKMKRNGGFCGTAAQQIILRSFSTQSLGKLRSQLDDHMESRSKKPRDHRTSKMMTTTQNVLLRLLDEPTRKEYEEILSHLPKDENTLSSLLVSLNRNGYHKLVVHLFLTLFSDLRLKAGEKYRLGINLASDRKLHSAFRRGMDLGPHFFVAVLEALRRGNQLRLAWVVWLLAKGAEKLSWQSGDSKMGGWRLPLSAHKIIMRIILDSAKRGIRLERQRVRDPLRALPLKLRRRISPSSGGVIRKRKDVGRRLFKKARVFGMRVIHTVKKATKTFAALKSVDHTSRTGLAVSKSASLPKPDAQFLRLALDLQTLRLVARRKKRRLSQTFWKRARRRARLRFVLRGRIDEVPRRPTDALMKTLQALAEADLEVPLKYQACLFGTRFSPSNPYKRGPESTDPRQLEHFKRNRKRTMEIL